MTFIIADWLQNPMILKREAVLLSQNIGEKNPLRVVYYIYYYCPNIVHTDIGQASTTKRNSAPKKRKKKRKEGTIKHSYPKILSHSILPSQ